MKKLLCLLVLPLALFGALYAFLQRQVYHDA